MEAYFSSPGRILGFILLIVTGVIWLYQEHKKNQDRKARRLAKQPKEDTKKSTNNL